MSIKLWNWCLLNRGEVILKYLFDKFIQTNSFSTSIIIGTISKHTLILHDLVCEWQCTAKHRLLIEQKLLNNVSCGFDDKSKCPTSSISVAGITRCISQIDYLSNLKANNDVIISSLEKTVEFDIDEEKYAKTSLISLSLSLTFYLSASYGWLYVHHQCFVNYSQIGRLIKW